MILNNWEQKTTFNPITKKSKRVLKWLGKQRLLNPLLIIFLLLEIVGAQNVNRPPQFIPGQDMNKFSLSEDTPVNAEVYQLKGKALPQLTK